MELRSSGRRAGKLASKQSECMIPYTRMEQTRFALIPLLTGFAEEVRLGRRQFTFVAGLYRDY